MKSPLTIVFTGALGLLLVSCASPRRQVTSASVLRSGTVPSASNEPGQPWRSHELLWRSGDVKRGCDVTVTYHGTENCLAHLEYVTSHKETSSGVTNYLSGTTNSVLWPLPGSSQPGTTKHAGINRTTVTLQDVTEAWLVCGDAAHSPGGQCSYIIDEIDCSRRADQIYPTRTNVTALAGSRVACGAGKQVVWTSPMNAGKPTSCSVTVWLRGSVRCRANLFAADAQGNNLGLQTVGEQPLFVTFHDIAQLSLDCWSIGPAPAEGCTFEIIQTECDK